MGYIDSELCEDQFSFIELDQFYRSFWYNENSEMSGCVHRLRHNLLFAPQTGGSLI